MLYHAGQIYYKETHVVSAWQTFHVAEQIFHLNFRLIISLQIFHLAKQIFHLDLRFIICLQIFHLATLFSSLHQLQCWISWSVQDWSCWTVSHYKVLQVVGTISEVSVLQSSNSSTALGLVKYWYPEGIHNRRNKDNF